MTTNDSARTQAFITRWPAASGSERANYQLFVTELCDLLGCPKPDPASDDTRENAYVFERRVTFRSEERRVGKECIPPCRSRWSPYH